MSRKVAPQGVVETCLYVDDLEAAEQFYCGVLGCEKASSTAGRHLFLRCGGQMLLLFLAETTSDPSGDLPPHGASGPQHLALAVSSQDIDFWRQHLTAHQVAIEHEQTWGDRGRSLYFRDPAGNSVELAPPTIWRLPDADSLQTESVD